MAEQRDHPRLSSDDRQALLRMARQSIEEYLASGSRPRFDTIPEAARETGAAFVTLRHRETGELRGCRGESLAHRPLADSVVEMAICSACDDPRFPPVTAGELPRLHIEINLLTPPRRIHSEEIVLGRHGLLLRCGGGSALFLPQVPITQGWSRERLLEELCHKGGLPVNAWRAADAELYAFETEAWGED